MKLDPRIKSQSLIYTPFNSAEIVMNEKGYFADELRAFSDLDCCEYCELVECSPALVPDRPYCGKRIGSHRLPNWFAFYIPESSLKPEGNKPTEKKYRPYTPEEFCDKFQIGQPIKFRNKGDEGSERYGDLQGLWYKQRDGKMIAYAIIESSGYALDELFNDFEWRGLFKRDFEPFGVEVEE